MSKLSNFYIEKAKLELNETETRKVESINLLIEWFNNHPFLKNDNETDELFLTIFLRGKKFRMDQVYESLEKTIFFYKSNPEYSNMNESQMEELVMNCRKIFFVPRYRDIEGRSYLIIMLEEFEKNLSMTQFIKAGTIMVSAVLQEEETQIAGSVVIIDCRGITIKLAKMVPGSELIRFLFYVKYFPVRIKKIIIVNCPSYGVAILELARSILPEKLKKRFVLVKNLSELQQHMDTSTILTKGNTEYDKENLIDYREQIIKSCKKMQDIEIDFSKVREFECVGSFRNLEID
ncbi:hypothetical protein PVAND_012981 [Polypedilum vanderplanki]|uniref:CRAL-TRIO domain-containing protein n=1 Tax=Polypedilum vanderplanki TaxID=319348 RepID=A0A9J6CP88_POLVA|nr:hypothetical protein PVAND_012981 [Polypedilum vanderplanki]